MTSVRSIGAGDRKAIRRRLLRWFARHRRRLPWRSRPTPYRVWVSEIMLQQTQVATVLPYFGRFVRRFPNVRALAAAELEEVLALWAGLGYYARARNLHRAARIVADKLNGKVPDTPAALMALPGIGRYTVGAILSIAFDQPIAVLDGNVIRVLCRLCTIAGDPRGPANQRRLWELAGRLVDPQHPSDFNQAMMELGALVCAPASPKCRSCPLGTLCRANRLGREQEFPSPTRRSRVRPERWAAALVTRGGGERVLMTRRPETGRWAGLWEFPGLLVPEGRQAGRSLADFLRDRYALKAARLKSIGRVRHQLTHRDMTVEVFGACVARAAVKPGNDVAWVACGEVSDRPVSKLTRKIAAMLPG